MVKKTPDVTFSKADLAFLDPNLDGQVDKREFSQAKRLAKTSSDQLDTAAEDLKPALKQLKKDLRQSSKNGPSAVVYFKGMDDSLRPRGADQERFQDNFFKDLRDSQSRAGHLILSWLTGLAGEDLILNAQELSVSMLSESDVPLAQEVPGVYYFKSHQAFRDPQKLYDFLVVIDGQTERLRVQDDDFKILKDSQALVYKPLPETGINGKQYVLRRNPQTQQMVRFEVGPNANVKNVADGLDGKVVVIDDDRSKRAYTPQGKYLGEFRGNTPPKLLHFGQTEVVYFSDGGYYYDLNGGSALSGLRQFEDNGINYLVVKSDDGTTVIYNPGTGAEIKTYLPQNHFAVNTRGLEKEDEVVFLLPNGKRDNAPLLRDERAPQSLRTSKRPLVYCETPQPDGKVVVSWSYLDDTEVLSYKVKPLPEAGEFQIQRGSQFRLTVQSGPNGEDDFYLQEFDTDTHFKQQQRVGSDGKLLPSWLENLPGTSLYYDSRVPDRTSGEEPNRSLYDRSGKVAGKFPELNSVGDAIVIAGKPYWVTIETRLDNKDHLTLVDSHGRALANSTVEVRIGQRDIQVNREAGKIGLPRSAPLGQDQYNWVSLNGK